MDLSITMLLSKRDFDHLAFTKKIIDLFAPNLTKAVQMFYKSEREIRWHSVERFRAVDNYVIVVGEVEVQPGDTISVKGTPVLIDETNIGKYTHTISYILNANTLQHGSVEAIYQHVAFVDSMAKSLPEQELIATLRSGAVDNDSIIENPALAPILDKITRPTVFESFDTSSMSSEQYNTLRLCANMGKTQKH